MWHLLLQHWMCSCLAAVARVLIASAVIWPVRHCQKKQQISKLHCHVASLVKKRQLTKNSYSDQQFTSTILHAQSADAFMPFWVQEVNQRREQLWNDSEYYDRQLSNTSDRSLKVKLENWMNGSERRDSMNWNIIFVLSSTSERRLKVELEKWMNDSKRRAYTNWNRKRLI